MSGKVYPKRDEHDRQVLDRCEEYLKSQGHMGYANYVQALRDRIEKLEEEREELYKLVRAIRRYESVGVLFKHTLHIELPEEKTQEAAPEAHVATVIKQWEKANPPGEK